MRVAAVTADLIFFSAVEGVAGAMGHKAEQLADGVSAQDAELVIVDLGSVAFDDAAFGQLDPMRTYAFAPHVRTELFAQARAAGIEIFRRGALATELPRLLSERG